ncbi:MAG: hypothetical protein IT377_18300 [Polyangiaceae bacterium]|nr:hypothetical protein [Polyangiaceae bacterium]
MLPLAKSVLLVSLFGVFAALSGASCSSVDSQEAAGGGGGCIGPACNPEDAGRDQIVADVPTPDAAVDGQPPTTNALCGTGCLPDDPNPVECDPTDASASPDASADADPDGATSPAPKQGCGVSLVAGNPVSACQPAGAGQAGAPCAGAADCAPGLACVTEGTTGVCRPYCCEAATSCGAATFCAVRPLAVGSGQPPLAVPVCVPADDCSLDEPYPCPPNKQCKCKPGTACALVKDDGTTSCVVPGNGRSGDKCPCAAGFVCSKTTSTCFKLCSTTTATPDCGTGKCLVVAGLPEGFGVCGLGGYGDGG